ncbi:MAG: hemerythrin domain-containing protein [Alphaproteobacteria bacterium]|nr:hemerythrin domain-containing protein [Alphaproteobacteria bacterium]
MKDTPTTGEAEHRAPQNNLAQEFRSHLAKQSVLCDRLEAVADSLPAAVNVQECLYLAQAMVPTVVHAHRFEEAQVFPLFRDNPQLAEMKASIERLCYEHMGDEDYAEQIVNTLREFVKNRQSCNPETMAWMLRGFFEAMRRHIAFEQEHVLPLLETGH